MQEKVVEATPKNTGRANETTAEEQALLEAKSRWTEQVERHGYATKEELDTPSKFLMPMLALDATKVGHRIKWEKSVLAQPKLDGVRCIWRPDVKKLQSRKGTFYEAPTHIIEALSWITQPLDGELYFHGESLRNITGAAKKWRPLTDNLEFHAFDLAIPELTFAERYTILAESYAGVHEKLKVVRVDSLNQNLLLSTHNAYVQEGYEGLMIRHADGLYDFGGRSPDLFKYKVFQDDEFEIVGVRVDNDGGAVLKMVTKAGREFESRPRGSLTYRQSLLDGASIGEMATVRYFSMTTTDDGGVPQFPVVVNIGDEK